MGKTSTHDLKVKKCDAKNRDVAVIYALKKVREQSFNYPLGFFPKKSVF